MTNGGGRRIAVAAAVVMAAAGLAGLSVDRSRRHHAVHERSSIK